MIENRAASSADPVDRPPRANLSSHDFALLRELLVGREQRDIEALRARLDEMGVTPEELAALLPEAIAHSVRDDDRLARALAPSIDHAITESVQKNPQNIADAIYPTLGPAIRKAISQTMAGIVDTINQAIEHSFSIRGIKWRLEAWRTGVPYGQVVIKHALLYRVEQAFLIHRETSLLLAHVTAEDLETDESDMISSMLTAIRDFMADSFQADRDGEVRSFTVGEHNVIAHQGPGAVLAVLVRGKAPPELAERVDQMLELLHLQFGGAFRAFDGDSDPFQETKPLLEGLLETVTDAQRPEGRRGAPALAWVVMGVAVMVLLGLYVADRIAWSRVVDRFAMEPGYVVLEADRGWRGWQFAGLRDPASVEPMALLASWDADTTKIDLVFEPYLSLDPVLSVRRATAALEPPTGVDLTANGNTLIATGQAPASWLPGAIRKALRLPDFDDLDYSGVRVTFPESITTLQDSTASGQVRFAVGSATLDGQGRAWLTDVAAMYYELDAQASPMGYAVMLNIIGRTDTTGTLETNRLLSQERAAVASRELQTLGVPPGAIDARGVGTGDPLPAADLAERARRNRSSSFVVRLSPTGDVRE